MESVSGTYPGEPLTGPGISGRGDFEAFIAVDPEPGMAVPPDLELPVRAGSCSGQSSRPVPIEAVSATID